MGYYSFGAHQSHLAKLSAKVSSSAKCICYVVKASENIGVEGKTFFFRMRKSVSHWHFPAFPQKVQWNGSLPSISTGVSGEVRRQEMWWTILLNCANWSCSAVNTNRHTVISTHIVYACGINMGERRAELSNQVARLLPEPFWLPREKRILFRRLPINGQYAPLPPLTL